MSKQLTSSVSLGVHRAEDDIQMLDSAFIETADYRTLIETSDKVVVVGRRGTGKSALTLRLRRHWSGTETTKIIKIAPREHQVIGIRPLVAIFGDTFNLVRAGSRLIWRYALLMEIAIELRPHYKFQKNVDPVVVEALRGWSSEQIDVTEKVARTLKTYLDCDKSPEELIGGLVRALKLDEIETALSGICADLGIVIVILVDRLDEGYEPDHVGVGFVDGLIQAAIDIKSRIKKVRPTVFLRDNIFRSVQKQDPDYTRNIEGHVLRLHWDENSLFTFATARIAVALEIDMESSLKIWNACADGEIAGKEGFVRCLRLTLYRPRDLLGLLNDAFHAAARSQSEKIEIQHVEQSANEISLNRFNDLIKEYSAVVPGLEDFAGAFRAQDPEQSYSDAVKLVEGVLQKGSSDSKKQQDFFILADAKSAISALYSVGFLGIQEKVTGKFVFCHDGRATDKEIEVGDAVLVHPCYWMAINCNRSALSPEEAEEVFDEYDIEVTSKTPEIRERKIDQLIEELRAIEEGRAGSTEFEDWCHRAVRICFAKGLRNVELKPNKAAKARRDIVGTNLGEYGAWKRIREDYQSRQVLFEVKNYAGLTSADYQQVQSYLYDDYGRFAVFITRDQSEDLYANKDVEWVREVYKTHKKLIIKITAKLLSKLLNRLKNPQKHDAVDNELNRLLDIYVRLYIEGQGKSTVGKKNKRQLKKELKKAKC